MDVRSRQVVEEADKHQFVLTMDGVPVGFAAYELGEGVITFTHTEIEPADQGHGLGGDLVMGALEDLRGRGLRVIAECPFVAAWIEKNPDYADLLADGAA